MEKSVADRAAAGEHEQEDEQLFPMGSLSGDGVPLSKLVKPGKDNKLTVSISKAEVPSGAGLADPDKDRTLLMTCEPGKVEVVPHKQDGKVVRYTTRQTYAPIFIEPVQRGDAGRLEAAFRQLILDDPSGAAKALDAMKKRATEELGK